VLASRCVSLSSRVVLLRSHLTCRLLDGKTNFRISAPLIVILVFSGCACLGESFGERISLKLPKLADFGFLPTTLKLQDFLPLSPWPTSKSQLSQFSFLAFADCTGVFSTLNYPYLAYQLKNSPRTQQSAFLDTMSYVTQVQISTVFPVV
jgi:hypothetical protein